MDFCNHNVTCLSSILWSNLLEQQNHKPCSNAAMALLRTSEQLPKSQKTQHTDRIASTLSLIHRVCRSETKTIWAIVMWTMQSVRVFTVCYSLRRRDAKAQESRGHLLSWAVLSLIFVTVWLTATTFNGWEAFIPSALSQAWPVMVSSHGGVKCSEHVPRCFKPSVSFDFRHLFVPVLRMSVGQERHKRSWHRYLMWSVVLTFRNVLLHCCVLFPCLREKKTPPLFSSHLFRNYICYWKTMFCSGCNLVLINYN